MLPLTQTYNEFLIIFRIYWLIDWLIDCGENMIVFAVTLLEFRRKLVESQQQLIFTDLFLDVQNRFHV